MITATNQIYIESSSSGEPPLIVAACNIEGSVKRFNLQGDRISAQFISGTEFLVFTEEGIDADAILRIYHIDGTGTVLEKIEVFDIFTNCEFKVISVGNSVRFTFFNETIVYELEVMPTAKRMVLPNVHGVHRTSAVMINSRIKLMIAK